MMHTDNSKELFAETSCRLCLRSAGAVNQIFGDRTDSALASHIFEITGLKLQYIPGVPNGICEVCNSQLTLSQQFVVQCREVDRRIRKNYEHIFRDSSENGTIEADDAVAGSVAEVSTVMSKPLASNGEKDILLLEVIDFVDTASKDKLQVDDSRLLEDDIPDECPVKIEEIQRKDKIIYRITEGNKVRYKSRCSICGLMQQNLKQHMYVHSGEKKHICPYCQKAFAQRGNLNFHLNIHTGNRPYECDQCEQRFGDPQSLRSHKLKHTEERIHRCEICGITFKYKHALFMHIRCHRQEKNFCCQQCPKRFLSSSSLKRHIRTHSGERPYQCSDCPKTFKSSSNLQTHRLTHTKLRPYECFHCNASFSYKTVLKGHMKIHENRVEEAAITGDAVDARNKTEEKIMESRKDVPINCTE